MLERVKVLLKELKMYGALEDLDHYHNEFKDSEKFLAVLLEKEISTRELRSITRKTSLASFPFEREWVTINQNRNPGIDFARIKKLSSGEFLKARQNICFIGAPGLGKTHSIVAIGRDLCRKGISVKCYTANDLVTLLEEAKGNHVLSKLMEKLMKPELLIIDELGFVPFSENGARLLFDVFARRYQKKSIAVTSNLSFDKWSTIFGSLELTSALIDRFCHKCAIFVFKGESVRFCESKEEKNSRLTSSKISTQ